MEVKNKVHISMTLEQADKLCGWLDNATLENVVATDEVWEVRNDFRNGLAEVLNAAKYWGHSEVKKIEKTIDELGKMVPDKEAN